MTTTNLLEVLDANLTAWGVNTRHDVKRAHIPVVGKMMCVGFLDGLPEMVEVDQTAKLEYQIGDGEAYFSLSDFRKDTSALSVAIKGLVYPEGYGYVEFDSEIADRKLTVGVNEEGYLSMGIHSPSADIQPVEATFEQARALFVACMRPIMPSNFRS